MSLFGAKKPEKKTCCCGGSCAPQAEVKTGGAAVKVLGSGCAKCNRLEAATKEALAELGMDTTIDHVTDFAQIAAYGVMSTPALVVNGKVVSYGKELKKEEVIELLKKHQA
ncbi:MAG: redox-active disulfide protein 2 [Clostridium sp. SCN 57-10]|nr:MAG: redox-active disulfide protein 2 [Clostridium sp. SCN 57-10]